MRLIDADTLLENQPKDCCRTSDWINAAPTIPAISVEWLRSVHENWLLTPDEMEFRDWLIERWQKEQEAR